LKQLAIGPSLLAFIRTVEHGSFAAAARSMGLSPAALGQSVRRLEDHLGVRLLTRTTRTMSLTAEGHMLVERARGPVRELDEIARIFEEARGEISGPLRVSAPAGVARHQLAGIVAEFCKRHPAVQLELDVSDELRDFATDAIDVGVRILRPKNSSIIARPIADLQAPTLASPGYLAVAGTPTEPSDLARHRCISYRYRPSGRIADLQFKIRGKLVSMPFRPALVVGDVDVACELAARDLGVVQPPSNYVRDHIESGRLVHILAKYTSTPWRLYLCYPSRNKLPMRVRAFIDFVRANMRAG